MARQAPIHLFVYYPKSDAGRDELTKRVAQVHAEAVLMRIKQLNCPTAQKTQLLDAVIADARERTTVSRSCHKLCHPPEQ